MAPLFQSLGQWAVVGLALASQGSVLAAPTPNTGSQHDIRDESLAQAGPLLRLMPLGASITYGLKSTDGNGYRNDLRQMLIHDGYRVDMVGSRKAGSMTDNDNEGWPGLRIGQVEDKARQSVPRLKPELYTINAGTNDAVQDFDIPGAGARMDKMIEYLWSITPRSTVVLSTLLVNANKNTEARVLRINEQIRALAKRKADQGKRIVLAEMHGPDGPQKGELVDGTHPNDGGYNKMAKIWHRSIREAANRGFLPRP
ncbi:hypothetical protein HIM_02418 [Hirsutella minnesotensis 3608]|nr:hypothetical protein HIM_02418 [Hirsutella minnesotensis 3608]